MTPVKITKEEASRIMKINGNITGTTFVAHRQYIIANKGEEAVKQIEQRLEEVGCSIKLKNFSSFKMYPEAQACLICLAILENFGWEEDRAYDIGHEAPLYSIVTKILMKYVSPEKMFASGPKYWSKYFDFGQMKCTELDTKKGHAVLRLDGFKKFHRAIYFYTRGYLAKLIEMGTNSKKIKVEQTKSLYNNDPYDEFVIDW